MYELSSPVGILLLEEQLIRSDPTVTGTSKRARSRQGELDVDTVKWIELSR